MSKTAALLLAACLPLAGCVTTTVESPWFTYRSGKDVSVKLDVELDEQGNPTAVHLEWSATASDVLDKYNALTAAFGEGVAAGLVKGAAP